MYYPSLIFNCPSGYLKFVEICSLQDKSFQISEGRGFWFFFTGKKNIKINHHTQTF